jgi:Spy/CpxP family protein refolding chaperone
MSHTDPSSTQQPNQNDPPRRRRRRWLFAGGLGLAAIAGLFATRAWAHHPHFGRFGRVQTEEQLRERLDRGADFALSQVDASDVQRARVDAILDQAAPGLWSAHRKGTGVRSAFVDALARGDRVAAENARKQGIAWADEISRQWLTTIEQSLAVLDETQRAKLREHLDHMRDPHHPHD